MRRAALIYTAGTDLNRFKVLRKREQLPFVTGTHDETDSRGAEYSLDDAFRLRLMLDLVGDGESGLPSIPPTEARSVIENAMPMFVSRNLPHPLNLAAEMELWAGVVLFEDRYSDQDGDQLRHTQWFAGTLTELPAFVEKYLADSAFPTQPVRTIIASATRAARFVRRRADELGIPERFDLYDTWTA